MKRGDLQQLPPGTSVVGIIDGVLLTDAAVGHREILALLEGGVKVYGGGSMGALRAAELSDLGMIGVGRIFQEYSSGRVDGDDEVVLAYDPFTLLPLSEPLINLRLNLEEAAAQGAASRESVIKLISMLKRTFYPRRSYDLLASMVRETLETDEADCLSKFLVRDRIDHKRNDAILLLNAVKKGC